MEKDKQRNMVAELTKRLQEINYDSLPISDYNKQYIRKLKPAIGYYLKIYSTCLKKGIADTGVSPEDMILVDYGGGSGFLSILAKEMGVGRVIYIDLNPLSVETIKIITKELGVGPDTILNGGAEALSDWCYASQIKPQLLIAADLIEHVYNLQAFFKHLIAVNDQMQMIFTTASTPFQPFVKMRLRKFMKGCERGTLLTPNYLTKRTQYIEEEYPHFSKEVVKVWAQYTRGLIYTDIKKVINTGVLPMPSDRYNTCDPETGNWAERILPIRTYRSYLTLNDYSLRVGKGFYNENQRSRIGSFLCRIINWTIGNTGRVGYLFAPFIILTCKRRGL